MQTENFVLVYSALVFHLPHTGSVCGMGDFAIGARSVLWCFLPFQPRFSGKQHHKKNLTPLSQHEFRKKEKKWLSG